MKSIILVALVATCYAAHKTDMLENNRIPNVAYTLPKGTCEECENIVKRFVEAAKDPAKMAELKTLLSFLCHETSYVDECRVFVSKLDIIIKKLEPWLSDSHAVCKYVHLCANQRLEAFRRIGALYIKRQMMDAEGVKDFACDECQFAAKELRDLVDDKSKQAEIKKFFSENICKHLGQYQGMCDMLLEQFLPELIQQLDALLQNPKQACAEVGFCPKMSSSPETKFSKLIKFMQRA